MIGPGCYLETPVQQVCKIRGRLEMQHQPAYIPGAMTDPKKESFASLFEAVAQPEAATRPRGLSLGERVRAEVVLLSKDGAFVELLDRGPAGGKRQQAFVQREDPRAGQA